MSQKELSDRSGVKRTSINKGISTLSSPSVENAYAIARVFDTPVEYLLTGEARAGNITLNGSELKLINLFRQIPETMKPLAFDLLQTLLGREEKSPEKRQAPPMESVPLAG